MAAVALLAAVAAPLPAGAATSEPPVTATASEAAVTKVVSETLPTEPPTETAPTEEAVASRADEISQSPPPSPAPEPAAAPEASIRVPEPAHLGASSGVPDSADPTSAADRLDRLAAVPSQSTSSVPSAASLTADAVSIDRTAGSGVERLAEQVRRLPEANVPVVADVTEQARRLPETSTSIVTGLTEALSSGRLSPEALDVVVSTVRETLRPLATTLPELGPPALLPVTPHVDSPGMPAVAAPRPQSRLETGSAPRPLVATSPHKYLDDLDALGASLPSVIATPETTHKAVALVRTSPGTTGFHAGSPAGGGRSHPSPSEPPPPPFQAPGTAAGPGASFFVPFAALLALLALAAPATFRRRREVPEFLAPIQFVCALERPG